MPDLSITVGADVSRVDTAMKSVVRDAETMAQRINQSVRSTDQAFELNIGQYTLRLRREPPGKLLRFVEISQGGKRALSIDSNEIGGWLVVNDGQDKADSYLPPAGKDITGDGIPDLVVEQSTGGNHCCSVYLIFTLGSELRRSQLWIFRAGA